MPTRRLSEGPAFERLAADECWRLLESRSFGRVCYSVDERVEVVLTAYLTRGDTLYFRAGAFGPVARQVQTRPVTLQVDDMSGDHQAGWSVTVTGSAHRVDDAATLASLWSPVRPQAWDAGLDPLWISLTVTTVQGQRVRR